MALIVFGSALVEGAKPNNLNIACVGERFSPDNHLDIVRRWARQWLKERQLELKNLQYKVINVPMNGNNVLLPVPYDMPLVWEVIEGDADAIKVLSLPCTTTISAALRAFGRSSSRLRRALREISEMFGKPCVHLKTAEPTWEEFNRGEDTLASLRSAIAKAPALQRLTRRPWLFGGMKSARLLLQLAEEDPQCEASIVVDLKRGQITGLSTDDEALTIKNAIPLLFSTRPTQPTE